MDHGWTQTELAERADVRAPSLSRVENGSTPSPSSEFVAKVAKVLGTTSAALMGIESRDKIDSSEFRQYVVSMVGPEHADLIEAIVHAAAEKPSRDRDVILRVARTLIETFPSITPPTGK